MSIFRNLPLRTKLIAAFTVPLLALALFAALQVSRSASDARDAQAQLDQVDRVVVFTELSLILSNEYDTQLQFGSTTNDQLAARQRTDRAFTLLLDDGSAYGFGTQELNEVAAIRSELSDLRSVLGDNPRSIVADATDQGAESMSLDDPSSAMGALVSFDQLLGRAIDLIDIDDSVLINPSTAVSLQSLRQGLMLDTSVRSEGLNYILLSQLPASVVTDELVALQTSNRADSRLLERQLIAGGDAEARTQLTALTSSDAWTAFLAIRDRVAQVGPGESLAFDTPVVSAAFTEVSTGLDELGEESINELFSVAFLQRADANRLQILTVVAALAVLGFITLVLFSFYRSISKPIVALTRRSLEIAEVELPEIVSLMRSSGVEADIPKIEPIERLSNDEVGELVTAFNGMHQTAVTLAAEQAGSRHTVGDMFVNLGRRNQKLLMRILAELDDLEAQERDPNRLEGLYRVDRLATRMRRNAESLLVLAGAQAARRVGQPVPFSEVARSAVSEVERFDRVKISVQGDAMVDGSVVVDIAHLLAELIENALDASPDDSVVDVIVVSTRAQHRIAVRDRGLGMSPEQLEHANAIIRDAADAEESPSKQLGLFVVGRLAARHGISVRVVEDIGIGLAALVDLPTSMIVGETDDMVRDLQQVTAPRISRDGSSGNEAPALAPAPAIQTPAPVAEVTAPAPAPAPAPVAAAPLVATQPDVAAVPVQAVDSAVAVAPKARRPVDPAYSPAETSFERSVRLAERSRVSGEPATVSHQQEPPSALPRRVAGPVSAPASAPEPALASAITTAAAASTGSALLPKRLPNATGFGSQETTPAPLQPASQPNAVFASRRTPGANLPQGVDPLATAPAVDQPINRPSAEALSSSLGSFQRGTKLAVEGRDTSGSSTAKDSTQ